MKVLFIISNFPNHKNPDKGIFYKRTIDELVSRGHQVSVIAPMNIFRTVGASGLQSKVGGYSDLLKVYRPVFFALPFGFFGSMKLYFIKTVVKKTIKKNFIDFDFIDSRYFYPLLLYMDQ